MKVTPARVKALAATPEGKSKLEASVARAMGLRTDLRRPPNDEHQRNL